MLNKRVPSAQARKRFFLGSAAHIAANAQAAGLG
jgi:hypothetical protein